MIPSCCIIPNWSTSTRSSTIFFGEANHVNARHTHLSSAWGMGAAHGEPSRDFVSFGDHILDGETAVGEGGTPCPEKFLVALKVHWVGATSKVEAEVRGEKLICNGEVVFAQQFLKELSNNNLIFFRHR